MINSETVKFFLMLDTLSQLSEGGFKPVSELDKGEEPEECIYYDDKTGISAPNLNMSIFKAVFIMPDEYGNYSKERSMYYEDYIDTNSKYTVNVIFSDEEPCIHITLDDDTYIIENGLVYLP